MAADTDEAGHAFQSEAGCLRIQMFAWTLILGIIFIWSVVYKLSFPVFDTDLLVLIGFVNANYLGFKFPENNKTQ